MITDTDVKKLKKVFATKGELTIIKDDVKELKVDSKLLQKAMIRLEHNMEKNTSFLERSMKESIGLLKHDIKESIDLSKKIIATNEGWAGKVADLEQESKMGAVTARRYGINIQELATATGTTLSV